MKILQNTTIFKWLFKSSNLQLGQYYDNKIYLDLSVGKFWVSYQSYFGLYISLGKYGKWL